MCISGLKVILTLAHKSRSARLHRAPLDFFSMARAVALCGVVDPRSFRTYMPNDQSKFWIAVRNNYTEEETECLESLFESGRLSYYIQARETGDSGTPHLQCYIEFEKRVRFSQVKALLPGWHLERRRGTAAEAADYCRKGGDYTEQGAISRGQGHRSDLDRATAAILDGRSLREVALEQPGVFVRYHGGLQRLRETVITVHNPCTLVDPIWRWDPIELSGSHIFWGPPGSGKTEYAKFLLPKALFVTHMDDLGKFDATVYSGIIFDDMSFLHLPREAQIHLVDFDNPRSIHVRYKVANIPSGTLKIFTTNVVRGEIFTFDGAINRRLTFHELQ